MYCRAVFPIIGFIVLICYYQTDPSYFHFGRPGAGAPLLNPVTHNIDAHLRTGNPDKHNAKIADPSYPFGRPGAGAPILNPVTQAVDAHRTGVRRDEKVGF